jgi:hypothetical protein
LSGRGLCDELITRPEESYRLWCVVVCDLETSRIGVSYIYIYIYIYIYMTLVAEGLSGKVSFRENIHLFSVRIYKVKKNNT